MTRRTLDLEIPGQAWPAWEALHHGIASAADPTPCRGADRDDWTGTGPQQERAAARCLDCPVLSLCGAYARAAGEREGVWGGRTASARRARRERGMR